MRLGARGVDRDQARAHDVLDIIRIAAAVVAVVYPDDSDAARLCLGHRDLRTAKRCDIADPVATIDQRGHQRLAHDPHRRARLIGLLVLGNRQDAWQAGKAITTQRVVDQLVGDDRRFIGDIADTTQRLFAQRTGFSNAEPHAIRPVRIEHSARLEGTGRTLLDERAGKFSEILGQVQLRHVHLHQHLAR